MRPVDFSKLTNDEILDLVRGALMECATRGDAVEEAIKSATLTITQKVKIEAAAIEAEAKAMRLQEAQRVANDAATKLRRDAEKVAETAEAKKIADLWKKRKEISDRVRSILGDTIAIDRSGAIKDLAEARDYLAKLEAQEGLYRVRMVAGRTWFRKAAGTLEKGNMLADWLGTEAEATAEAARINALDGRKLKDFTDVYCTDPAASTEPVLDPAKIAVARDKIAGLEKLVAQTTRPQTYRIEIWKRGADQRVFIARTQAGFGESLFDWYESGNAKHSPKSFEYIASEAKEAAKARGVTVREVLDGLEAFCADLCGQWETLKIDECDL